MNIMTDNKWMQLRKNSNGEPYVAMKNDAVMIIAITNDRKILFIKEQSIAYQEAALTLPTGGVNNNELPEISADRELQEEVGHRAEKLTYIGTLHPSVKYMKWKCHIYIAQNLILSEQQSDETSPIEVIPIGVNDFERAVASKQISDSTTIAALFLARQYI